MVEDIATVVSFLRYPSRLELYRSWQQSWGRREAKVSEFFALESIYLLQDSAKSTDATLVSIQGLWKSGGVRVDGFQLGSLVEEASPQITRDFFKSALLSETDGNTPTQFTFCPEVQSREFRAACSAIVTGPSIRQVYFELADCDQFWQWVAYAVFSAEATHEINRVELDVTDLTQADVQCFQHVLAARDPLVHLGRELLSGGESSATNVEDRAPSVVDIAPHATLLVAEQQAQLATENRIETLRVVEDSPDMEHVAVVYPGAGICWIHRSEIIARREICLPSRTSNPSIQSMALRDVGSTSVVELTQLLKPIGSGLQTLTIDGDNDDSEVNLDDNFFTRLFAACPGLRRLNLIDVNVTNFKWLGTHGTNLESLLLNGVESQQRDGYKRMLKIAGSSATHLHQLHIHNTADHLDKMMGDIMRALKANGKIERLLLTVDSSAPEIQALVAKAEPFQAFHNMILAGQAAPFPLTQKLAFLSALSNARFFQPHEDKHAMLPKSEPGATAQLDAVVISTIFQFAAPRKRRMCGFFSTNTDFCLDDDA